METKEYVSIVSKPEKRKHSEADVPFAKGMSFYKLFCIFMIGSFGGVVIETVWCIITKHEYQSRVGMLYGPFNAVYGVGAVLLTVCLHRLGRSKDLWVFFGSAVIGAAFEYICSLFQEVAFGTVSWEYSHSPFNIAGRTNLKFALFWGILGLAWVKEAYPFLSRLIEKIPKKIGKPLTWALLIFMIVNLGITALAVARQADRRANIPAVTTVSKYLDERYDDEYLKEVFPNMMTVPRGPAEDTAEE